MGDGATMPAHLSAIPAPVLSPLLHPTDFAALEGWPADDHAAALTCFRRTALRMAERAYATRALGIDANALAKAAHAALAIDERRLAAGDAARAFFEAHFRPHRIDPPGGSGFVTGYYEPEIPASPVRTPRFGYPLYRRPADLVEIADENRPAGWNPELSFARRTAQGLVEYHDRAGIEAGALAGRGLELAWIESPVDGFFIHVQGSALLLMPDRSTRRVSYAGKSGHPYTSLGRILVEEGELLREQVTMQSIRDWLHSHPERMHSLLRRNRSFIFFAEVAGDEAAPGPVGAASVPLTPGRSLAVDHALHTFGSPFWISVRRPLLSHDLPLRRLMIAQDTGSAIVGPARGDLFIGTGEEAGAVAGAIRHDADFFVLVPKLAGANR